MVEAENTNEVEHILLEADEQTRRKANIAEEQIRRKANIAGGGGN
jgi:hypothetical protein